MAEQPIQFPVDPLERVITTAELRRSAIAGVLESYNGNYDVLAEAVQNAVDAVEDAHLKALPPPYLVKVVVNLAENWISVLDTGIGMTPDEVCRVFGPNVSLKDDKDLKAKRGVAGAYRGYKGVGLTFLAYGTDGIWMHSKRDGTIIRSRMEYGRAWAKGERPSPAMMVENGSTSPLDGYPRGTYVRIEFSEHTRPRSLAHLCSKPEVWGVILRTRTAIGQVLLGRTAITPFKVQLEVVEQSGKSHQFSIAPSFLFPHEVPRQPPFRFLSLPEYHEKYGEQADLPKSQLRQDGLYLEWDTARIRKELLKEDAERLEKELAAYSPYLYAFIPYHGILWLEINEILTGVKTRQYLRPGLIIAVNRQRLSDVFPIDPTRNEYLSRNIMIVVHFDNARPDQGRKTLQDEVLELAKKSADRAVQYLARQRGLLMPPGDDADERVIEKTHDDWTFNVKQHAQQSPIWLPPLTYVSTPRTEQDVIGLFHQLSTRGLFPGLRIFATSQNHTYDSLVQYDYPADGDGLKYVVATFPLGLSSRVIGSSARFETKPLTLEYKNTLDALIADINDEDSNKSFRHINICVCWSAKAGSFQGYFLEEINDTNLDRRLYPGVTDVLHKDGDTDHNIQVIMLEKLISMIKSGRLKITN